MTQEILKLGKVLADKFLAFNKTCISPYHVVSQLQDLCQSKKFTLLEEDQPWTLETGKTYFLVRGGFSSFMAFHIPKNYQPLTSALKIFGTHCDSPCIRLSPKFISNSNNYEQVCVQLYGGGIWHTWYDRDLLLGGRVVIRENGTLKYKLFATEKPVAKISTLAIHLQKDRSKLEINKENDLKPILSSILLNELGGKEEEGSKKLTKLQRTIAGQLGCGFEDVVNFDLCFGDSNPPDYFGLNEEFISSARIDNVYSVFCSMEAFCEYVEKGSSSNDISIISVFDHEEIGSQTFVGADSNFGPGVYRRIVNGLNLNGPGDIFDLVIAKSLLVSADMAHSIHPNFQGNHQKNHQPEMNKGVVLKVNCNGNYTTDANSGAVIKNVALKSGVPLQEFVVPNDSPCGSTIGPLLASKLGCMAVDIGAPQLGMHSIRETAGVMDFEYYRRMFLAFMNCNLRDELPRK